MFHVMGSDPAKEEGSEQRRIQDTLESIEKRIKQIESSLKKIDKTSILTNDDQLFFGMVLSFALLFATIPDFDFCTIFANFGFKITATQGVLSSRVLLFASLIFASATRYYVIYAKDSEKNRFRKLSVGALIFSIYWPITDLIMRGLTGVLGSIYYMLVFVSPIALTFFALPFSALERKWYKRYGDSEPIVSLAFAFFGVYVVTSYDLAMFVAVFVPTSAIVQVVIVVAALAITFLIAVISIRGINWIRKRRSKKEK